MNKILIYIFIIVISVLPISLEGAIADTIKIQVRAKLTSLDIQDNIYAVDGNQRILKYNRQGEKLNYYQNNRLGKVQQIDVTNPHKILVFYPEQQTIIFLDRNMTELSRIELNQFNLSEISTAGLSNDNQVWIFDEFENALKKIDASGNIRSVSESTIGIWGESLQPYKISERFNRVHLLDRSRGIFIFDNQGTPLQEIKLLDIDDLFIFTPNTLILNHRKKGIGFYQLSDDHFSPLEWPEGLLSLNILQLVMSGRNLLILTEEELIFIQQ